MARSVAVCLMAFCCGTLALDKLQDQQHPVWQPNFSTLDADALTMDYLIQDVCLDNFGAVVVSTDVDRLDPALCASHRDLSPGELLPYHKHDMHGDNGMFNQLSDSFPLLHDDGTVRVLQTLDFADHGANIQNLTYLQYDKGLDGYNANQAATEFASIIGTEDPSCGLAECPEYLVAPAVSGNGCTLLDSWGLWDKNLLRSPTGNNGSHLFRLNIQRGIPPSAGICPTFYNDAFTQYALLPSYHFQSGKILKNVVREQHWAGATFADATSGETQFFTREYGLTRWEAWQLDGHCGPNRNGHCHPGGVCGTDGARAPGGWVRVDCRDWTFLSVDPDGGYPPQRYPVSHALVSGANLMRDGDFGQGAQSIGGWSRATANTTNWSILKATGAWNYFLATNCIGHCAGNMVYQDVPLPTSITPGTTLSFGAQVRASSKGS